jgi:flagellar biosynthetic protein FliP
MSSASPLSAGRITLLAALLLVPALAISAPAIPALSLVDSSDGGKTWSVSIQILLMMTALTLLPSLLLAATSFTRIVIVLAILRQALGAGQTPPNQVLIGLSLFLTFFVMSPVIDRINADALQPYLAGTMEMTDAAASPPVPLQASSCSARPARPDIAAVCGLAGKGFDKPADIPLSVLLPAFATSELKTAFQIGFLTLHSVPDHRPGGGERADVDGHDDALADAHLAALQDHAVRARRRLGTDHGHARQQLCTTRLRFTSMTPETVLTIARESLTVTTLLAAPLLLVTLVTGVTVGILQAATQINEMTLSFIPKLLALMLTLLVVGPWMLQLITSYTRTLFTSIPGLLG